MVTHRWIGRTVIGVTIGSALNGIRLVAAAYSAGAHARQLLMIPALFLAFVSFAGCDTSNNPTGSTDSFLSQMPDNASDDDVCRAFARVQGEDEDKAVVLNHRHKDEDPVAYRKYMKELRHLIKYSGGNEGTTTLGEWIQSSQAAQAKSKAEEAARQSRLAAEESAKKKIITEYDAKIGQAKAEYRVCEQKAHDAEWGKDAPVDVKERKKTVVAAEAMMRVAYDHWQSLEKEKQDKLAEIHE